LVFNEGGGEGLPSSRPRRPDAEASRQAILAAAATCFSASGYAGTSMHDIAAAAGVTQSLIHHYFGAKDLLWREVRRSAKAEYRARVDAALGREGGPTRAAMADLFAHLGEHPEVLRMVAWADLEGDGADARAAPMTASVARIAEAQRAGRIRADVAPDHILTALMGVVRTWFSDRNLVQDETDPEAVRRVDAQYLDAAWALFTAGAIEAPEEI
jgi:TetR/AcrR family transcriptional regulator